MPYKDRKKQLSVQKENSHNRQKIKRILILEFLGGRCERCSLDDFRCLQIDHIEPLLRNSKNKGVKSSVRLLDDIIMDREDIDNLQLLCANCHMIKSCYEDVPKYINYTSAP